MVRKVSVIGRKQMGKMYLLPKMLTFVTFLS